MTSPSLSPIIIAVSDAPDLITILPKNCENPPNTVPPSINLISPEKIAAEILAFSGIHTFAAEHNTLRVGSSFYQPRIESTLTPGPPGG